MKRLFVLVATVVAIALSALPSTVSAGRGSGEFFECEGASTVYMPHPGQGFSDAVRECIEAGGHPVAVQ